MNPYCSTRRSWITVPLSSTSARNHASITCANASITACGAIPAAPPPRRRRHRLRARYFRTVRQSSPVSRAISETLSPASCSARNRRSSSHRSAQTTRRPRDVARYLDDGGVPSGDRCDAVLSESIA